MLAWIPHAASPLAPVTLSIVQREAAEEANYVSLLARISVELYLAVVGQRYVVLLFDGVSP